MLKPTKFVRGTENKKFCIQLYVSLLKRYGANKWFYMPGPREGRKLSEQNPQIDELYSILGSWHWYEFSDRRQMQFNKLRALGLVKIRQKKPGDLIYIKLTAQQDFINVHFVDLL